MVRVHYFIGLWLFLFFIPELLAIPIKIACIGNSITEYGYPTRLQELLGADYQVENDGVSGTTLLKKGDFPYWNIGRLAEVFDFQPDIVTIKMGTNDSKPQNWIYKDEFDDDLNDLIDTLNTISSHPLLFLVLPVPAFANAFGISGEIIEKDCIPIIQQVAQSRQLPVIDCHSGLIGFSQYFPDGVHPNSAGNDTIAHIFARAILSSFTGIVYSTVREMKSVKFGFNVSPNPFQEKISIVPSGEFGTEAQFFILNIKGVVLCRLQKNSDGNWSWNASGFPPGVYLAVMRYSKGCIAQHIVCIP